MVGRRTKHSVKFFAKPSLLLSNFKKDAASNAQHSRIQIYQNDMHE